MARSAAKTIEFSVDKYLGVNRLDQAEKVLDNEFFATRNLYQATKGAFNPRFGTTYDLQASQIPGAKRISGIHRHFNQNREKYTFYFCEPNTTALPDNTTDLTLTDVAGGGDIFGGGSVVPLLVCYSFYGLSVEQTYNTRNRASFPALPVNAWSNPAHQTITLGANTNTLRVTVPGTFPSGVRGCNIFVGRGGGSTAQMTYMGSVTTPGGHLDVTRFIGPSAAANDSFGTITCAESAGGTLKPGSYYVSLAWVCDPAVPEGWGGFSLPTMGKLSAAVAVSVSPRSGTITVQHSLASSTNGAKACYVFVGTQPDSLHAMTCVGIINDSDELFITSIPESYNAQSHPDLNASTSTLRAFFDPSVRGGASAQTLRTGFMIKKDASGNLSEVFTSRSLRDMGLFVDDPISGVAGTPPLGAFYFGYPKTANDNNGGGAIDWGLPVYDPEWAYLNGLTYFANGAEIPWMTDGHTMGQLTRVNGTLLPPQPRFIMAYQSSLVVAGAGAKNQIYFSNANSPQNWAQGGTGTLKNFMSIGDLFGDEITAMGVFTLATDGTNNPRSFLISMKKHGIWMKDTLAVSAMEQLSGRNGTVAYRSLCSTPIGLVFLGFDGDWYRIMGSANEPTKFGTKVQPVFAHLPSNDTLMRMVSAVYHDNYLKVCYPSASTSTGNDAQFWADLRPGSPITWFGEMTGVNVGAQVVYSGESDDLSRVGVLASGAAAVKLDDTSVMTDLGVAITPQLQSKNYRFRSAAHLKRIMGALFDVYWDDSFSQSLLLEGFADQYYGSSSKTLSSGAGVWDSSAFDQSNYGDAFFRNVTFLFGASNLVGRTFYYKLTYTGAAQIVIAAKTLLLQPERRMTL